MKKVKSQAGFSLIELMMVVVIIGVLAGVGIPQYQKFQMKAKQSEVKSLLSAMYTSQRAFYAEWTRYYGDFNAVGYGVSGSLGYSVGFSGAGVVGPANHPNVAYAGIAAPMFTSAAFCAIITNGCNIANAGVVAAFPAALPAVAAFTFAGMADLDDDVTDDTWTINQAKTFVQITDDIGG